MTLTTPRLTLMPYSVEITEAAQTDKTRLTTLLNLRVPDDWPWSEVLEAMPVFAQLAADPTQQGWGAWLIVHTQEQTIIGDAGFGGKPNEDGIVEMGYDIIADYRNQGYGFEAVQALVNWAMEQPDLKKILASCPVDNFPSIRILEKLGMKCVNQSEKLLSWELTVKST